jgi:hypothetical protein
MRIAAGILAGIVISAGASAQNIALREDFTLAVPPPGWSHVQNNPLTTGWIQSADGRAWHQDESSAVGTCDDELIAPLLDLTGYTAVYAHFRVQLAFPQFLANHPNSSGDGETDLLVRVNGGPWTEAWTESRQLATEETLTADLTALAAGLAGVEFAFRYYGTFAHETWVDFVQVDDSPEPPLDPPILWTSISLPAAFAGITTARACDDFEAYAGVPPAHMALTALDAVTLLPDSFAWCSLAGGNFPSASGARNLEMGLLPGSSNYHLVRNALVIGYDGYDQGEILLEFQAVNHGEELHAFDGVWISEDGFQWWPLFREWAQIGSVWTPLMLDLAAYTFLTNGPFYVMFGQEDNFPYANLDGVGVDDVCVTGSGPVFPSLTKSGACPGPITLTLRDASPGASVIMLYGAAGTYTQSSPSAPCQGLTVNLALPSVGGYLTADAQGQALHAFTAPAAACGFTVQFVDLATCRPTNSIIL